MDGWGAAGRAAGFSLLRRVRELPQSRCGATPAIALTAYAQKADRHRALLAGFQEHLAKPVDARPCSTRCAA